MIKPSPIVETVSLADERNATAVEVDRDTSPDATLPIHADAIEAMCHPQLIRCAENLIVAKFSLIKIIPARHIIRLSMECGRLKPGGHVIDTSSGTFALALALIGLTEKLRVTIVCDPAIDANLKQRIELLGATVVMVDKPESEGGYQAARLKILAELLAANPNAYWPRQYHNPENRRAFGAVALELRQSLGKIDCVVGTVGSGGTMSGLTKYLRLANPNLHAIAIDSHGSVLFGQPDSGRLIRGAGSSIMFDNVIHERFDEVHWMTAGEAFQAARRLYAETGLFVGATSGAAMTVGRWCAQQHADKKVVAILPDEGYRYQQMFYDDTWLRAQNVELVDPPPQPEIVQHPRDGRQVWTRLPWGRRTYEEVVGLPRPRYPIDPEVRAQ